MNSSSPQKNQLKFSMALTVSVFVFAVWVGFAWAVFDSAHVRKIISETLSQFAFVKNLNQPMIFLFIFLNNAIKSFLAIVSGILFGIVPVLFIFVNGELIGLVYGIAHAGSSMPRVLAGTLPHGILEIPAVIMSAGYGLWLGFRFFYKITRREPFKPYFVYAMKKYLFVVVPMLFVAALIETFLTPIIIRLFE